MHRALHDFRISLSDCPTCAQQKVAPDSPATQLESTDSAELLISAPQPPSEAPAAEAQVDEIDEVDERLRVVVPDAGHLSGRRSFVEVRTLCTREACQIK